MASLLNENQPTDPISLLPYKKPTRVLPCGHTFNHSSLASLLDNNNGDATLACPVCRKRSHVRGVNEYPRNYGMEQQMDFQQEKEDKIRKEKMDLVIKTKIESNEEKKKLLVKAYGEDSNEVTDCLIELGNLYNEIAEYDKAMKCYKEALPRYEKSDDKIADVARTYCKVGAIYAKQDEYDKSMEYFEKALPLQVKEFGTEEHVDVGKTYALMGWACSKMRKDDQAMEYCMKSLKIRLKVLDEDWSD